MSYCKRVSSLIKTDNTETQKRQILRIRCKQWDCPHCASILKKQWQAVLLKQLPEISKKWSFSTITLPSGYHASNDEEQNARLSAWFIKGHWDKFIKALKREYGAFEYVRVIEMHKDGALHLHCLFGFEHNDIRTTKPKGENRPYDYSPSFRKLCVKYGFGKQSQNANLGDETSKTIAYVSKYLTKADSILMDTIRDLKIRRIQTSRGIKFDTLIKESDTQWDRIPAVYEHDIEFWDIYDLDKHHLITKEDFSEKSYYPSDLLRD